MYFARRSLIALLLLAVLSTACGGQPAASEATPDINATVAAAAETLAAALFQTQTALAPTITNTVPPSITPLATNTALALPSPLPSATQQILYYASPTPTGTFYTLTPSSSSLASGCNNLRLIESYTDPAGPFTPGQKFTQYWQVENNGTCDWLYLYRLEFVNGERLGGSAGNFGKKIPPYKWTTLSVGLTAPNNTGTFNGSWRFTDGNGKLFGATLPVSITVKKTADPTATLNIAQTADAAVQQTAAAAAQQTAVQSAIQTAIAASQTAQAAAATATCGTLTALGTPCP